MSTRGIRGAVVASENSQEVILAATRTLILAIVEANPGIHPEDVASIFFTVSGDLNAAFPALAVRQMGWVKVPILCAQEIPVPKSLGMCIRILIHWNTDRSQDEINPVYLGDARILRPDISGKPIDE
jgi:chorismate mutase